MFNYNNYFFYGSQKWWTEKIFTFNNQEINADIIKCRPKNGVNAIKKPTENPMEIEYEVSGIRINLFQKYEKFLRKPFSGQKYILIFE